MGLNIIDSEHTVNVGSGYKLGLQIQNEDSLFKGDIVCVYDVSDGKVFVNTMKGDLFNGKFSFDIDFFINTIIPNSEELEKIIPLTTEKTKRKSIIDSFDTDKKQRIKSLLFIFLKSFFLDTVH